MGTLEARAGVVCLKKLAIDVIGIHQESEKQLRVLKARHDDQSSEIVRLKAALAVFEKGFVIGQADVGAAIRKEGMGNSRIMNTLHYLTDLYGPRLTGSPNHATVWRLGAWVPRD